MCEPLCRHTCSVKMEDTDGHEENGGAEDGQHGLDRELIRKASEYLFHFHRNHVKRPERIILLLHLWTCPNPAQIVYIPLPHWIQQSQSRICLFTKVEPEKTVKETKDFYKNFLSQRGVMQKIEILPLEDTTTPMPEKYNTYRGQIILADSKIRTFLQYYFGECFCEWSAEFIDLESEDLAADLNSRVQSTRVNFYTGDQYGICVGHTDMVPEQVAENILAVAEVLAEKLPMKWKQVKSLSLKPHSSKDLQIFVSSTDKLKELGFEDEKIERIKKKKKKKKKKSGNHHGVMDSEETADHPADEQEEADAPQEEYAVMDPDNLETGIPFLDPVSSKRKTDEPEEPTEEKKLKL